MDTSRAVESAVEKHFSGLLAIHGVAHEDAVDCEEFRLGVVLGFYWTGRFHGYLGSPAPRGNRNGPLVAP